jgi:hypothetical protein
MVIPGRNCVARIKLAPDAYGILRQAVRIGCVPASRSPGGPGVTDQRRAAHETVIIDVRLSNGQRA